MTEIQENNWEIEFEEKFGFLEDVCVSNTGARYGSTVVNAIPELKSFIRRQREEAEQSGYEKGFIEGQKKAFGVDREAVRKEATAEIISRVLSHSARIPKEVLAKIITH